MIKFEKYKLKNGLTVILHQDKTTPLVFVNTIFNVGARDENENLTGFAHLFEHLMFGGSKNIPNYDEPIQNAGGENNAFTSNDITNYYNTLPSENIETALWLESDRLKELEFSQKSLDVQKQVVIEEFKQRYLNQPYGDAWLEFRPLIFKEHSYKWATIGKNIEHIEKADLEVVKAFFYKHYTPKNAVLVIGGNFNIKNTKDLIEKWYSDIESGNEYIRNIKPEPLQTEYREKTIERKVPANAIYLAFRIGNRLTDDHYIADLLSDILSSGKSSRFHNKLVKELKLFSQIHSYVSSGWEHGLFVITGHISDNEDIELAKKSIFNELELIIENIIEAKELQKVKNKLETVKAFEDQNVLSRVMNLAQFELLGIIDEINDESIKYDQISSNSIQNFAKKYFLKSNCSTLIIKSI